MRGISFAIVLIVAPLAFFCRMYLTSDNRSQIESTAIVATEEFESSVSNIPSVVSHAPGRALVVDDQPKAKSFEKKETSRAASKKMDRLQQLLKLSIQDAQFEYPLPDEIERFEKLLGETIKNKHPVESLVKAWKTEGWILEHWKSGERSCFAVYESDGQQRGRGFFAFQAGNESNLVLQAPHRFYDRGTGTIVMQLFQESDCFAAAWNTIHRRQFDLAHQDNHFINAFTRAVLRSNADATVVQIHGFDNAKQTGVASTANMIVSDATKFPGRLARSTATNLKECFGTDKARLFPIEVNQLGGTTNAQAGVILDAGSSSFLHLELNKDFRDELRKSAETRHQFVESLAVPQ